MTTPTNLLPEIDPEQVPGSLRDIDPTKLLTDEQQAKLQEQLRELAVARRNLVIPDDLTFGG